MQIQEYYLVTKFIKKQNYMLANSISFEPTEVILCNIKNGVVEDKGKKLFCLSNFDEKCSQDEFYGFPIKIYEKEDKIDQEDVVKAKHHIRIIDEEYCTRSFENILKEVKKYEYVYTAGSKDGKFISMIYAVNSKGDIYNVDFSLPFYANFYKMIDEKINEKLNGEFERQISTRLDRTQVLQQMCDSIISQDEQVKVLVNTVLSNQRYAEFEGLKENLMIIGPTGTGKTLMCKTLSKILEIPIIIKDATKYSTTGYVGLSVVEMLGDLYKAADYDLELTQKGIIVIDEFDKLGKGEASVGSGVRTKDVQQELLGMLDGGVYTVSVDKNTSVDIDTSNITFVLAGAFQDLLKKVSLDNKSIGFGGNVDNKDIVRKITRDELMKYGGIERELLRRISSVIQMNPLYKEELKQILTTSKISNLKVWQEAFLEKDGVNLVCTEKAYDLIAEEAYKLGSGASGLKSITANTISEIKAKILDGELSNCEIEITEETVKEPTKYLVKKKEKGMNYELSIFNGANY